MDIIHITNTSICLVVNNWNTFTTQGHTGLKGLKGDSGERGESGKDGVPGIPGSHGRHGEKGDKGTITIPRDLIYFIFWLLVRRHRIQGLFSGIGIVMSAKRTKVITFFIYAGDIGDKGEMGPQGRSASLTDLLDLDMEPAESKFNN